MTEIFWCKECEEFVRREDTLSEPLTDVRTHEGFRIDCGSKVSRIEDDNTKRLAIAIDNIELEEHGKIADNILLLLLILTVTVLGSIILEGVLLA